MKKKKYGRNISENLRVMKGPSEIHKEGKQNDTLKSLCLNYCLNCAIFYFLYV